MKKKATKKVNDIKGVKAHSVEVANYVAVLDGVVELLESARRTSARARVIRWGHSLGSDPVRWGQTLFSVYSQFVAC